MIFHNVQVLGGLDFDAILLALRPVQPGLLARRPRRSATSTRCRRSSGPGRSTPSTCGRCRCCSQLMTSEIDLRRISRIVVALVALVAGLAQQRRRPATRATSCSSRSPSSSARRSSPGLFVCAASLQFFLINGAELTNAFTYGGSYASSQPASIFPGPLKLLFGYLVPVVFTAYLPTLALLDLPGPAGLPTWLALADARGRRLGLAVPRSCSGAGAPGTTKEVAGDDRGARSDGRAVRRHRRPHAHLRRQAQGPGRRRRATDARGRGRDDVPRPARASPSATSAPTARASRPRSRCSAGSWCRPRAGSAPVGWTR